MAINDIPNLQFNNQQNNNSASQNQYNSAMRMNNNLFQSQSIFMPPMGNIYEMRNSSEIGSIPIGNGVSAGLCLSEGTLYLKSMQSNGPAILGYRLTPLELVNQQSSAMAQPMNRQEESNSIVNQLEKILQKYDTKISELGNKIANLQSQIQNGKTGGDKKWEI